MYNKNNNIKDELNQVYNVLYINVTEIILVHQCNHIYIYNHINETKLRKLHQSNQVKIFTSM